jgi:hypothetical protein
MKKIEDYRVHAAECRCMANRARSPEDKAMLMNMAATWESLAVDPQRNIARQARIDELDKRAAASVPVIASTLATMTDLHAAPPQPRQRLRRNDAPK